VNPLRDRTELVFTYAIVLLLLIAFLTFMNMEIPA
jgi:hypothetical protein